MMDLSTTYRLNNPFKMHDELKALDVNDFLAAVDEQLFILIYKPDFFVSRVEVMGDYYVIYFSLEKFKDSPFALLWFDTVPRADIRAFTMLRYTCDNPDKYFLANMEAVALDWIKYQEIE